MHPSSQGIIRREVLVVKALHPIGEVTASIVPNSVRSVRLVRAQENGATVVAPRRDPVAATVEALAEPLEFPPLASAVVPGDHVAIALDGAVPSAPGIVQGVIESLRQAGIDGETISVVTSDQATSQLCRLELHETGATEVRFVVHDPDDERDLCLVGITDRGERLVLNRTIFDADVVLPVSCARLAGRGVYESLYPWFSDAASIEKFRSPPGAAAAQTWAERTRETNQAGWLIGVPMVVEVVPGLDESAGHVIAGEPQAVTDMAEQLCRQQWLLRSPQRASLVIATIAGAAQAQNWNNVARALAAAERLVEEGGAVAICSNLDAPPGESLSRLIDSEDLERTERRLLQDHAEDSWAAWQLARALQNGPVYVLSQLDPETVENLGLAPVASIHELARLASRHESVAVIEDAQHAMPTVDGEDDEA
jgi:nickel-dependent lactate racemase